jgi:hypothetical protein
MAANIRLKRSNVPGYAPSPSNLLDGEVALNTNDGILYFRKIFNGTASLVSITNNQLTNGSASVTLHSDGTLDIGNYTLPSTVGSPGTILSVDVDGHVYWASPGAATVTNKLTNGYLQTATLNDNGTLSLPLLSNVPANPQTGQMALADGIEWDPLNKQQNQPYLTLYTGSVWIEAGGLTMTDVTKEVLHLG